MNVRVLKNEQDYEAALHRADEIFNAAPGTAEGEEVELLFLVIKDYEDKHYPILPLDPIEALKLAMAEKGIKNKDLTELIGSKGYVSAILNRKKPLTLKMARLFHQKLGIPAETLLAGGD
ncbi:MAG: transcriptional regulator [Cytophagaceae bacterium]|nr:transcriptional regulator [Cytophagaceae bacterium]